VTFLAELAELFPESVTLEPYIGEGAMGASTYGAGVARACHIEGSSVLVRDSSGQERTSSVQVYLAGAFGITEKDRLTLPSPWNPTQPPIIAVGRESDELGPLYEVAYA